MDASAIRQIMFDLIPDLAAELNKYQEEKKKEEELLTFRQAASEYKLSYSNLMTLKAKKLLVVTYVNDHPFLTRKEAQRQQSLKGKHNKSL